LPLSESTQNLESPKIEPIWLATPGDYSSPPGSSNKNPETGASITRRLAVGSLPPGGSYSGTQV